MRKKLPKVRGPYWRKQLDNSPPRAYADFRFLGGKQEPLVPPGDRLATTDPVIAAHLYAKRLADLAANGVTPITAKKFGTLSRSVAEFLVNRRRSSRATSTWLDQTDGFLERAVKHFGADRPLRMIKPRDVAAWVVHLRSIEGGRRGHFTEETIRKHLQSLTALYKFAQREEWVPLGYSPVSLLTNDERPGRDPSPDKWLEVHDAAKLLEAARTFPVAKNDPRMALAFPIIATFLLTGGRADEVLGLTVDDILFDRKLVAFRPTAFRRGKKGKTEKSARMVPLWPQLEGILRAYLDARVVELAEGGSRLLFPSPRTGGRIADLRKLVDPVAKRAGLLEGMFRATAFRKTYATARLQTLDNGAPIAPLTVQRELGHSSGDMMQKVYGRLGTVRHRSEVIEYRMTPEAHGLADQSFVAEIGTEP